MMTKTEFVNRWKHSLGGMVLDAMQARNGPAASLFTQTIMEKIEKHLGLMYAELVPDPIGPEKPKPPANGATGQQQARKVP